VTTLAHRPRPSSGSPVPPPDSPYWRFYEEVAAAQLAAWLPGSPQRVLDLSGAAGRFDRELAGHHAETADVRALPWLEPASVDVALAEAQTLGLAAELTVEELCRVLVPGGRLLLVVESLVLGLARLAGLGRWAELADVPSADVVLVPGDDGTVTRCFGPDDLRDVLTAAGLHVDWVRPRCVLSSATVERALESGGDVTMRRLVESECRLAQEREGESTGLHLVASARRPEA
jgi:hypothetical protein